MDFYTIKERSIKKNVVDLFPDFKVCRSKDLMVRGRAFYAIWDEAAGLWSTDEYDVQRLVDDSLRARYEKESSERPEETFCVKYMGDFSTKSWAEFRNYVGHVSDNSHQLDMSLTFANTEVKKKDHVSRRLPYPLERGTIDAYDELIGTLYEPEERAKLEWAIGSIVAGDAKDIQKFIVLYGDAGAGKSTILNIVQKLFEGYYTTFEAKALTANGNAFATEVFKSNPLVAIQHDGDLSKIEDNTKLNSIISHEEMTMNEKYKPSYTSRINSFLFMATNRPVKITDAKSGIIRRLIDVRPSGNKVSTKKYHTLISQIDFELGAIAHHCLDIYREMGKNYYSSYRPLEMMLQTDVFFNFVESNYHVFNNQEGVTLSQAYEMYKVYCDEALVEYKTPRHKFREELKNYFAKFHDMARVGGCQVRSYYETFLTDKFKHAEKAAPVEHAYAITLDSKKSLFDEMCRECTAQYATASEKPLEKWSKVTTTLGDLNTKEIHYVRVPEHHIVIDFDLKDDSGEKALEKNIEAASKWPSTYTELSKSGAGLHLHYLYGGDPDKLSRVYDDGIEIKVFTGNSSLRRKLTKCNNVPVATINSGLPLKGEDKVINLDAVKSEKGLRELIKRNLRKDIHPGTKPSVDFILKILDDAHASGLKYDVTDMRPAILAFANSSSHQSFVCIQAVMKMKFKSEEPSAPVKNVSDELVFFDVEVFPNLFVVVWKAQGKPAVRMINPGPKEIEFLLTMKLVGFNCRRYDNHIIYAAYIGYNNEQLYKLSQRIIGGSKNAMFSEAYNISYTDIYDYSTKKQGLKKFQIELGLHHKENHHPWDQPVPKEKWIEIAEYCENDVVSTEATHEARKQDFIARLILAELSGLTPNDSTQNHMAKIVFGNDPRPQDKFIYTDLSETFPGYKFEHGKSTYRGEEPSEGGYVHAVPGMYSNVPVQDVKSMHPTNIREMNTFGPYTQKYVDLVEARFAVKDCEFDIARNMLDGVLAKYLEDVSESEKLAYALKIGLNIVYGLTAAKFDNKFRDPRNIDNIVAKRGALFMIDLKYAVEEKGFVAAHIKTDSIKVPNATPEMIQFITDFGKKYGYTFEHEATYDRFCLVNDAVYIARYKDGKHAGKWTATGAQFAQPFVFKTLFSKEPIVFEDMCEIKTVTTAMYLDFNEGLPEGEHNYQFVGKVGSFCPVVDGAGGGQLFREKDEKYYAVGGTKGYRWMETEVVKMLGLEDKVDRSYYTRLVDEAVHDITKYGDFEWFVSESNVCGQHHQYKDCEKCPHYPEVEKEEDGWFTKCKAGYDTIPF